MITTIVSIDIVLRTTTTLIQWPFLMLTNTFLLQVRNQEEEPFYHPFSALSKIEPMVYIIGIIMMQCLVMPFKTIPKENVDDSSWYQTQSMSISWQLFVSKCWKVRFGSSAMTIMRQSLVLFVGVNVLIIDFIGRRRKPCFHGSSQMRAKGFPKTRAATIRWLH